MVRKFFFIFSLLFFIFSHTHIALADYVVSSNFTGQGLQSRTWKSITSSADGVKLAATAFIGYIYTSTDS